MKKGSHKKLLAMLFGPLALFDRQLVLLGTLALIPEALLLYAGLGLGNPKCMAIAPFVLGYHLILAFPEKWEYRLPSEFTEPEALSRTLSIGLGLLAWMVVSSPVWWPVISVYMRIFSAASSIKN